MMVRVWLILLLLVSSAWGADPAAVKELALAQIHDYYNGVSGSGLRLYQDRLPPVELAADKWAQDRIVAWTPQFFATQDPVTGLVAIGGNPSQTPPWQMVENRAICQHGPKTLLMASELLVRKPDDVTLRAACDRLATATVKACRFEGRGIFVYVNAATGFPESDAENVIAYGHYALGLARMGKLLGRQDLLDEAWRVSKWLSDHCVKWHHGLLPDMIRTTGGIPGDYSTDGIYWIRCLGEAYLTTGDGRYKELILKHGLVYYAAWNAAWGHYSTHVEIEGSTIRPSGIMYGDSKHNTPRLCILLHSLTRENRYRTRFDDQWRTFAKNMPTGWISERLKQGQRDGDGVDANQTEYLGILLYAYRTFRDRKYLRMASERVDRLLTDEGKKYWRADAAGGYLLEWAEAVK